MLLVDQDGGPLGAIVAPANAHDSTLIGGVIEAVVVERPDPRRRPQNLCLDKGFDTPNARAAVAKAKYIPHIRSIGEELKAVNHAAGHKPRRWVVERTFAWLGRCRRLTKDWERSIASSTAWALIASIRMLTRRTAKYCFA